MNIAVVGSGVSGLVCANLLRRRHDVTLFEAEGRPGGHTNTVQVALDGQTHSIDTGFIVYNERTYPGFVAMLEHLGVTTQASDMSFSVADDRSGVEWRGSSLSSLFAQRRNAFRPAFHRMLVDVVRFNRAARRIAAAGADPDLTLGEFIARGRWSPQLVDWYLVPMGSAIWSADPRSFADIPLATFARFFDNHGLLRVGDQPSWRTVTGGAARYVEALLAPLEGHVRYDTGVETVLRRPDGAVELRTSAGALGEFDHVVLAVHSDQALRMLADPSPAEKEILGAIRYQPNDAVLHTDARLLPRSPRARASWNYHRTAIDRGQVAVTYDMNRLQGITTPVPVMLTLNRTHDIDPSTVLGRYQYDHPVLDGAAVQAQRRRDEISGQRSTSYAGAYWGYGFHEDGVQSALHVCRGLGVDPPW